MKAVLLVSHGSQWAETKIEISDLVNEIRLRLPQVVVDYAFLEIESPNIPEAIDQCVSKGAKQIILTLNFLNSGRHVNEDIPAIVRKAQQKHPEVEFKISKPLGKHPRIPNLFIDLIENV